MPAAARHPGAAQFVPDSRSLRTLSRAAADCRGCELYRNASQVVFGEGDVAARLMLVGEQPGDVEDRQGHPFVGPAGGLLDRALTDAGLADVATFTTNAVKHFKWKQVRGGKRRIHDKPTAAESTACRPWLAAELRAVNPSVVVALGATAAGSLFGGGFRLTQHRGEALPWPPEKGDFAGDTSGPVVAFATIHPSAVLRAPDDERHAAYAGFVRDLKTVAHALADV